MGELPEHVAVNRAYWDGMAHEWVEAGERSWHQTEPTWGSWGIPEGELKVLERSDASYKLYHGAIWLEYDKATFNYRWGGAHCSEQSLSDINISLLFAAFRAKYSVTIDYVENEYKERTYRCITGFSVTR